MAQTRTAQLETVLARAMALSPWLGGLAGHPPGGHTVAALAADARLVAGLAERAADRLGTDRRDVAAGLLFHDVAWRVIAPPVTAVVLGGLAPRLTADDVTVVFDDHGASTAVHFTATDEHRAPDPSDQHRRTLLRRVRDDAVATLQPFVVTIRPLARRGAPSLWGEVADTIASALQSLGDAVGDASARRADADDLLDGTPPLRGTTNWVTVEHGGVTCTWRMRNTCCNAYRLGGHEYCANCPLLDADDRMTRLRGLNAQRAAAMTGGAGR